MYTLLLRLAGPLQAWGTDSRFEVRQTELYPTKSGLTGLIAAALGMRRDASLKDLSDLRFGVRADQPGRVIEDFHIAQSVKTSYVTRRYYLSDAVFVVGIESDDLKKLEQIKEAILHPEFPLFLGRRSCVPDPHIVLGIEDRNLLETLTTYPWQGTAVYSKPVPDQIPIYLEGKNGCDVRRVIDDPVSFDPRKRQYKTRLVSKWYAAPRLENENRLQLADEHDPFMELEV